MQRKKEYYRKLIFINIINFLFSLSSVHAMEMEDNSPHNDRYQVNLDRFTPVMPVAAQSDTGLPIFPVSLGFKTIIPVDQQAVDFTFWHIGNALNEKDEAKQYKLYYAIKNNADSGALDYLAHEGDIASMFLKTVKLSESQFPGDRAAAPRLMDQAMDMLSKHFEYPGMCHPQQLIKLCEVTGARRAIEQLQLQGYPGAYTTRNKVDSLLDKWNKIVINTQNNSLKEKNNWQPGVQFNNRNRKTRQGKGNVFKGLKPREKPSFLPTGQNADCKKIITGSEWVECVKKNVGKSQNLYAKDSNQVAITGSAPLNHGSVKILSRASKESKDNADVQVNNKRSVFQEPEQSSFVLKKDIAVAIANDSEVDKKHVQYEFHEKSIAQLVPVVGQVKGGQCASLSHAGSKKVPVVLKKRRKNQSKKKLNKKKKALKVDSIITDLPEIIENNSQEKQQELSPEDLFKKLKDLYYGEQKNYKEAFVLCNQLIDSCLPNKNTEKILMDVFAIRGDLCAEGKKSKKNVIIKKDLKKSLQDYENAIELGNGNVIRPYARLLYKNNEIDRANVLYERILAYDDTVCSAEVKSEIAWQTALLDFNQGNFQKATEKMCDALSMYPHDKAFEIFARIVDGQALQKLEKAVKKIQSNENCDSNESLLCYIFGRLCYESKDERFLKRKENGVELLKFASQKDIKIAKNFFSTFDNDESVSSRIDLVLNQLNNNDRTNKKYIDDFANQGYLRPLIAEFINSVKENKEDGFFSRIEKKSYKNSVIDLDINEHESYQQLYNQDCINALEEKAINNPTAAWLLARIYFAHAMNLSDNKQAQEFVKKATELLSAQNCKKSSKCKALFETSSDVYGKRNKKLHLETSIVTSPPKKINKKKSLIKDFRMRAEEKKFKSLDQEKKIIHNFQQEDKTYQKAVLLLKSDYDDAIERLCTLAKENNPRAQLRLLELYTENLVGLNSNDMHCSLEDIKQYSSCLSYYWAYLDPVSVRLPSVIIRINNILEKLDGNINCDNANISKQAAHLLQFLKVKCFDVDPEKVEEAKRCFKGKL